MGRTSVRPGGWALLAALHGCGNAPVSLGTDEPEAAALEVPARWSWSRWRPSPRPPAVEVPAVRPSAAEPGSVEPLRSPRCRWVPSATRVLTPGAARTHEGVTDAVGTAEAWAPEARSLQRLRGGLELTYTAGTENGSRALLHQRLGPTLEPRSLPERILPWPDPSAGDVVVSVAGLDEHHAALVSTRGQGCWFLPWQTAGGLASAPRFLGIRSCVGLRATEEGFVYFSSPEQGNPGDVWLVHLRADGEDGRGHAVLPPVMPVMHGRSLRPARVSLDRFVVGWEVPLPAGGIAAALVDSTGSILSGPETFPLPEAVVGGVQLAIHAEGAVALWASQSPVTGRVQLRSLALGLLARPALEATSWTPEPAEGVRFASASSLGEPVLAWATHGSHRREGLLQVAPVDASGRPRAAPLVVSRCADAREVVVATASDGAVVVVYTDLCKTAPVPALVAVSLRCQ